MFTVQTTCHYSLLGLATDASNEEIAAAYARALARFKRRLAAGNPLPIEHLDALRDAHRTLSEPELRAAYDSERITETTPASDSFPTAAQMAASVAPALTTKPRWAKAANTDDSADDASTPPTDSMTTLVPVATSKPAANSASTARVAMDEIPFRTGAFGLGDMARDASGMGGLCGPISHA